MNEKLALFRVKHKIEQNNQGYLRDFLKINPPSSRETPYLHAGGSVSGGGMRSLGGRDTE